MKIKSKKLLSSILAIAIAVGCNPCAFAASYDPNTGSQLSSSSTPDGNCQKLCGR